MSIVLWAQEAVLLMLGLYWTVWDRYMQVLYLGRALRTKETLSDFLKWRRVTRHPLVFRGLTGSQWTPGFWGITFIQLMFYTLYLNYIWKHYFPMNCTLIELLYLTFFPNIL